MNSLFSIRRPGGRFLKKLPPWTPCKNFLLGLGVLDSGIIRLDMMNKKG
jgi:hypothetical protein